MGSRFKDGVIKIVNLIPEGTVVSYGQVALYLGVPRGARQVGWILNGLKDGEVPWWRVVNNEGRISIKNLQYTPNHQKQLLVQEGIKISEDLTFDIEKYRFIPDEKFVKRLQLDQLTLDLISRKLPYPKPHIYPRH